MSADDQIAFLLDLFREKPSFLSCSSSDSGRYHPPTTTKKVGLENPSSFASIWYKDDLFRLVYLYRSIRLEFEVSTSSQPYEIRFIPDKFNKSLDVFFIHSLEHLCQNLISPDASSDAESLFSTISRLLGKLQKLSAPPKLRAVPYEHHASRLMSYQTTAWDLPLFLMRCAATSRTSTKLCNPFPKDTNKGQSPSFTLSYIRDNLPSYLQNSKQNLHPTKDEFAMLEFLSCLQWTEHVQVDYTDNIPSPSISSSSKRIQVSLQLNRARTPKFLQLAKERGSVLAYHGTSVENAWSILNYGLQKHPSLQKNGAIMGPGIYLSSKYDVAYFFATQNGSAKHLTPPIWKVSPCFWRLFGSSSGCCGKLSQQLKSDVRHEAMDMLCYVVVECTIIRPSDSHTTNTKQDDHYYVATNPQEIHMERVHLTFEFHKQVKLRMWITLGVVVVLAVWKISRPG